MFKFYSNSVRLFFAVSVALGFIQVSSAQTTITTNHTTGFTFFAAPAQIAFVVENTNSNPITLTGVSQYCEVEANNGIWELYYSATSLSGTGSPVPGSSWTLIATSSQIPVAAAGIVPIFTNLNFTIPANTQYRFAMKGLSPGRVTYGSATVSPATNLYSADGIVLKTGTTQIAGQNVGYSGNGTTLATNPRFWHGSLTFAPQSPCVSPPTPGDVTGAPASGICSGTQVNLNLTGNTSGIGQTYTWQSSSTLNGTYTDVAPASSSPNITVSPSVTTFYRVAVTCSGNTAYSDTVQVPVNPLFPANTYTINQSAPVSATNFQSFAAAVNAMNCGIAGNVIFEVPANQTFTEDIPQINVSGSSSATITFIKTGTGSNPKIIPLSAGTKTSSATLGTDGDGIIVINGGDYITFNGIDLDASSGFTGNGQYEYGYYLKKASGTDACKNVSILNSTITLSKAIHSFGIFVSNNSGTTAATVTSVGGRSENIKINGNTIDNSYGGISVTGYSAAAPYDLYDHFIEVGVDSGNVVTNYAGGATAAYGIYVSGQDSIKIAKNTVTSGSGSTTTVNGIYAATGTNSSIDIYNNTITIQPGGTTVTSYALYNAIGSTGTSNLVNIYNNTISNCATANTITTGALYLLYNGATAYKLHIYGNQITNNSNSPTTTGALYCLYNASSVVNEIKIYNNTISDNARNTGGTSGAMYGLYSTAAATATSYIYGNTVSNLINNNSTGGLLYGITQAGTGTSHIYKNNIFGLQSHGASALTYGIHLSAGVTNNVYNNFISDLQAPVATSTTNFALVRGISVDYATANTNNNVSFNSVYLSATSSGATFGSAGVYHQANATATTANLTMKSNNIVNSSSATGTRQAAAFVRSGVALNNYNAASNNNNFYGPAIFYDGTNTDTDISLYKQRVNGPDVNSVNELPPFLNISSTPYDLHLDPTISTQLESGAMPVTGITDDFDGNTRHATTPDIGADELNGIPIDLVGPAITYTDLMSTCYPNADMTLNGVTISDVAGVPTTGSLVPRIYYRKNNGSWFSKPGSLASGTGTNGTWNFSIVAADISGVNLGDVIEYYVIAQDVVTPNPNISSNPGGVTASNVNTISVHPTAPNTIYVGGAMSGNYNVGGTAPIFKTLTHAIATYNASTCLNAPVTFTLIDNDYSSNETFPIIINDNPGATDVNTLTIKAGSGINPTISGFVTSAGLGLIRLNGADHVTFDSITVNVTGTTATEYGYGIQLVNDADSNTIKRCTITTTQTPVTAGSTSFNPIVIHSANATSPTTAGDSRCDYNTIANSMISGGYYGITIYANGTTDSVLNNRIIGNTIQDYYSFGVYLNGAWNTIIDSNDISRPNRTSVTTHYGVYAVAGVQGSRISRNRIHNTSTGNTASTSANYGIYFTGADAPAANPNIVSNNMIYAFDNAGIQYGVYNSSSDSAKYYYNSILLDNSGTSASATAGFYQITAATGLEYKNNIVSISRASTGTIYCMQFATTGVVFSSDYNDLNMESTTGSVNAIGLANGTQYPTLANWRTATGNPDMNSLDTLPLFVSNTDLHLQPSSPVNNKATSIASVTVDIDGQTRSGVPDIGADELPPVSGIDINPTALLSPAVAANGCYNIETITVRIRNNSINTHNFVTNPTTVRVDVTGAANVSYTAVVNTGTLAVDSSLDVTMVLPSSTLDMSAVGTYTFRLITTTVGDVDATNDTIAGITRTRVQQSAGTLSSTPSSFCVTGGKPTLSSSGVAGYSNLQWQESTTSGSGFTNISGATTNPYTVASNITDTMYYRLIATCGTVDSISPEVAVIITNPQVLSTTSASRCGSGKVTLSATGNPGATVKWYAAASGGTELATGNTFTTPSLTNTTSYYVAASDGGTQGSVGALNTSIGTGASSTIVLGTQEIFVTISSPVKIISVDIYPTAAIGSNYNIAIRPAGSTTNIYTSGVFQNTVTSTGGTVKQTVMLNADIPPGNYEFGFITNAGAWRNQTGGVYPYVGGPITITGNSFDPVYYYFFYDWKWATGCENTTRTAVTATINPVSGALAGSTSAQQCGTVNIASTADSAYNNSCDIIAKINPTGAAPVSGDVNTCVTIDNAVQFANGQPYVQRHYDITPANNPSTATARVTLFFLQSEFDAFNAVRGTYDSLPTPTDQTAKSNLRITKFGGTGTAPGNYTGTAEVIDPADSDIVWNAAANRWEVTFNVTGFSGFYVHTGNYVLPVTITNFRGERAGSVNKLYWTTSTELNNAGFELQRSADGVNFSKLTYVASKAPNGNSTAALNYNFDDVRPLIGNGYYRLKQIDKDGKATYSTIVLIKGAKVGTLTISSLYPNPPKDEVNVVFSSPSAERISVAVTDLTGKVIMQRSTQVSIGDNKLQLNVSALAQGSYFIKAICSNGCETAVHKFIKQ